ncbi:MAG: hypothetical protein Q9183_001222 [Haloplaca sp. 2 TL-2023]
MSEYAIQFAVLVVDETFGELPAKVFHALAFLGRLQFSSLVQHTQITPAEIKHCLSVLIQQHLVLWSDSDDSTKTSYEADLSNAYALARSGKYIQLIEGKDKEVSRGVLANVLVLGHARVGDLTRTYFPAPGEGRPFQEYMSTDHRDTVEDDNLTVDKLHSAISSLLVSGFLRPLHESYLRPAADNLVEAQQAVPLDTSVKLKKDAQAAWEYAVKQKLDDWKYGTPSETKFQRQPQGSTKRGLDDTEKMISSKRAKLMDTNSEAGPRSGKTGWLDENLVLRVNHEKFAVIMRNQQLVALVKDSLGPASACVYSELLRIAETRIRKCRDQLNATSKDEELDVSALAQVSTSELDPLLLRLPDLSNTIGNTDGHMDSEHVNHSKSNGLRDGTEDAEVDGSGDPVKDKDTTSTDGKSDAEDSDVGSASSTDEERPGKRTRYKTPDTTPDSTPKSDTEKPDLDPIRQHLLLLMEHPSRFLIHVPRTLSSPERWAIPYSDLSETLFQNAILSITTSRFGRLAGRLLRILCTHSNTTKFKKDDSDDEDDNENHKTTTTSSETYTNPKLDEKMLCSLSLIPQKAARTLLHHMHCAGLIELQEVPKDSTQRRPGSTIYFWFFDGKRCRERMLEETYKTMGNLVRRARVEKESVRGVVEKSERTDVVGREKELLGAGELKALARWREKEMRIWGEVGRLDDLVGVLRDF